MKQGELKKTLFPIGNCTKSQVRDIARRNKFPNHDKKSTVGICFIGKVNLKKFLKNRIRPKAGKILNPEGQAIGEHDGIYYYTIGQRIGPRFGIEVRKIPENGKMMRKWYVAKKDAKRNIIVAAPEGHELLYRKEIVLSDPHWISGEIKKISAGKGKWKIKVLARIRQVGELLPSTLDYSKGKYKVVLKKAITGVSEGQACVLYRGKEVLGGGEIRFEVQ